MRTRCRFGLPLIILLSLVSLQPQSPGAILIGALNPFAGALAATPDPAESQAPSASTQPFVVFDATLYENKPSLMQYGFRPFKVVYPSEMWKSGQDLNDLTDESIIRTTATNIVTLGNLVALDIETWPLVGPSLTIDNSLGKYLQTIHWFRAYAPHLSLGYYGLPPLADYWRAINGLGPMSKADWQRDNDRIQSLADSVDIFYPSLYTYYVNKDQWVKFAIAQITEARRLAKGKPVYPFIWPQYHDSNPTHGLKYLRAKYWKLELETVRKYADGVVIWGGYDLAALQDGQPGARLDWDDNAAWWKVTKKFLATLKSGRATGPEVAVSMSGHQQESDER